MTRRPWLLIPLMALNLIAGFMISTGTSATAATSATDVDSQLDQAHNNQALCQAALITPPSLTSSQRTWAQNCVTDMQRAIDRLTGTPSPSPSASPTASPSPSPTTSPTSSPTPSPTATTAPPSPTPSPSSSPTPSPTPTTTPPVMTHCIDNPSSCGFPDASNTGVPAGTNLTVVNGDMTVNGSGTTLTGLDVRGCIRVTATNVTIRNSKVTCLTAVYGIVYVTTATGLVDHVQISCGNRGGSATGIGEDSYSGTLTTNAINVSGCENGWDIDTKTTVTNSWCHDLFDGPGNHTDCIQGIMETNVTFQHNTLDARGDTTSAIEADGQDGQVKAHLHVLDNLLNGGAFTLYCPGRSTATDTVVTDNRFGPDHAFGFSVSCAKPTVTWSGNVRDVDGSNLPAA